MTNYLRTLGSMIQDEGRSVSVVWFTREMGITVTEARRLFQEYVQSQPKHTLKIFYYISGSPKTVPSITLTMGSSLTAPSSVAAATVRKHIPHIVAVVPDDQLEATKASFTIVTSCHIYSIQVIPSSDNSNSLLSLSASGTNAVYTILANDLALQTKRFVVSSIPSSSPTTSTAVPVPGTLTDKFLHNSYSSITNQPPIRIDTTGTKRPTVPASSSSSSSSSTTVASKSTSIGSSSTSSNSGATSATSTTTVAAKKNTAISNFFGGGAKSSSLGSSSVASTTAAVSVTVTKEPPSSLTKAKPKRQAIEDSDEEGDANFSHAALDAQRERDAEEIAKSQKGTKDEEFFDDEDDDDDDEDVEDETSPVTAASGTGTTTDTATAVPKKKAVRKPRDPNAPKVRKNAKYASYAENDTIIEGGGTLQKTRTLDSLKGTTKARVLKTRTYVNEAGYMVTEDYWEDTTATTTTTGGTNDNDHAMDTDDYEGSSSKTKSSSSTKMDDHSMVTTLNTKGLTTSNTNKGKQMIIDDEEDAPEKAVASTTLLSSTSTTSSSSSLPVQSVPPPSLPSKANILSSGPPPSSSTAAAPSKTQLGLKAFFGAKK